MTKKSPKRTRGLTLRQIARIIRIAAAVQDKNLLAKYGRMRQRGLSRG
jgi:hypothetical protein